MKSVFQKISSFPVIAGMLFLLLQSCILMYGCSSPAVSPSSSQGQSLYAAKCGSCHRLLSPQDYPADRWRLYVDKYGKTMPPLQKQTVLEYLYQHAADAQNNLSEFSQ